MKVAVIAADEKRDRQKFISKPLLQGGHDVSVVKTRPLVKYLFHLFNLLLIIKPDVIIFIGTGVKEFLALGFVMLFRRQFVVRFGGDRLRDLESVAKSHLNDYHYLKWTKYKVEKIIAKSFLKRTQSAIVVNESLAIKMKKYLKAPCQITVIPQFCEGEAGNKDYTINYPVNLLTVTNFLFSEKAKGVIWLIDSLNQFVQTYGIRLNFRIAGSGRHIMDVESYLRSANLSELLQFELLGYVDNIDELYRSTDVFIYRSYHDATPNVILESKKFGLPLLANKCEEFQSIVEDGYSGYLYTNKNNFNERLFQLIENEELRKKLGLRAVQEYIEKYTIDRVRVNLENALSKLEIEERIRF